MRKHKKWGWVRVLKLAPSNRGGLIFIETPGGKQFWVRAYTLGLRLPWRG